MVLPNRDQSQVLRELDTVVLTRDLPEYNLVKGDVGAIVHHYLAKNAFEVEFVAANGKTIAVATLMLDDVRPLLGREILHVRELAVAG